MFVKIAVMSPKHDGLKYLGHIFMPGCRKFISAKLNPLQLQISCLHRHRQTSFESLSKYPIVRMPECQGGAASEVGSVLDATSSLGSCLSSELSKIFVTSYRLVADCWLEIPRIKVDQARAKFNLEIDRKHIKIIAKLSV